MILLLNECQQQYSTRGRGLLRTCSQIQKKYILEDSEFIAISNLLYILSLLGYHLHPFTTRQTSLAFIILRMQLCHMILTLPIFVTSQPSVHLSLISHLYTTQPLSSLSLVTHWYTTPPLSPLSLVTHLSTTVTLVSSHSSVHHCHSCHSSPGTAL